MKECFLMKNIVKKIAVYSMVGMLQVGFGVSIIEASPLHNSSASVSQQSNDPNPGKNRPCLDRNGDRGSNNGMIWNKLDKVGNV
jgi:hypothetical protein